MTRRLRALIRWTGLALLLGLAVPGCGGNSSTVEGRVTYQGKQVVWGTVTLVDTKGEYHQSYIDLDGNYKFEKIPVGTVKIGVISPNPDPRRGGAGGGKDGPTGSNATNTEDPREKFMAEKGLKQNKDERPKPPPGKWFEIDMKYADPENSGLNGEVKSGKTTLNIDIK